MFLLFLLFSQQNSNFDIKSINGNVKLDFEFKGDKSTFLSSLIVELKTVSGSLIDQTEVQPTGYFVFTAPEHREVIVSISDSNGFITEPSNHLIKYPFENEIEFVIKGFSVSGSIVTKDDDNLVPISGLKVCIKGASKKNKDFQKFLTSSSDGKFSFGPLNQGKYIVSVENVKVKPQEFKITQKSISLNPFIILEWPQTGIIKFPNGVNPRKVSLKLRGVKDMIFDTDETGFFTLDNMKVGRYIIESNEEGVYIQRTSFELSSLRNNVMELNFLGVLVEGRVALPNNNAMSGVKIKLNEFSTITDESGKFRLENILPTTTVKLEAELPYTTFNIPHIEKIETSPITNVFIEVRDAKVELFVDCDKTDIKLSGSINKEIKLNNKSYIFSAPAGQELFIETKSECIFEVKNQNIIPPTFKPVRFEREKATVKGSIKYDHENTGNLKVKIFNDKYFYYGSFPKFEIEHAEFGEYQIVVEGADFIKWKYPSRKLQINKKVVEFNDIVKFESYNVDILSSHNTKVISNGKFFELKKGSNHIITDSPIISPADCFLFKPINILKTKMINVESIERRVVVKSKHNPNPKFNILVSGKPLEKPYKFTQPIKTNIKIEIKPESPYYSETPVIEADSIETCLRSDIEFNLLKGIQYQGKIDPPLENVNVTLVVNMKGSTKSYSVITNKTGMYDFGSYPSDVEISISAHSAGYSLTQIPGTIDFTSEKLSSIIMEVDKEDVIFSISNNKGFRNTTYSNHIDNIPTGEYYVKPILKEYEFIPPTLLIKVEKGKDAVAKFTSKRKFYGISGYVKRITGQPETYVEVYCILPNGNKQIATTDSSGFFRIGMLHPNQNYTVYAKQSSVSSVSRITPESFEVELGEEDFKDIKFQSIKSSKYFDVLGEISITDYYLKNIEIVLTNEHSKIIDRFAFSNTLSKFFYFFNISNGNYLISIAQKTDLPIKCPRVDVHPSFNNTYVISNIECIELQDDLSYDSRLDSKKNKGAAIPTLVALVNITIWCLIFMRSSIRKMFQGS